MTHIARLKYTSGSTAFDKFYTADTEVELEEIINKQLGILGNTNVETITVLRGTITSTQVLTKVWLPDEEIEKTPNPSVEV